MDEFIDFCIMCGCDYCDRLKGKIESYCGSLKLKETVFDLSLLCLSPYLFSSNIMAYIFVFLGIGPSISYKLIKQHRSIDKVLASLDPKQFPVPEHFPYKEARAFFRNPEVSFYCFVVCFLTVCKFTM